MASWLAAKKGETESDYQRERRLLRDEARQWLPQPADAGGGIKTAKKKQHA